MNSVLAGLASLPDLIQDVRPGVVHVDFTSPAGSGNGSGFAIEPLDDSAPGVIVTNAHVARETESLQVRFYDDTEADARVRVCDDSTDLALLEIDRPAPHTLPLRPLSEVRLGEPVAAIGSPYGLEGSVTFGIVSGLDRTMPAPNRVPIDNMIQTDALINPGNSGGPLIGLDGSVVGVNDQILVREVGGWIGFAIPSDTVRLVYEEILATGAREIIRATLSTSTVLRAFTSEERRKWGQRAGALVVCNPRSDTPADAAGLQRGDVIVNFDGELVDEPGDLYRLLDRRAIDRECRLEYLRDGDHRLTVITPRRRANHDAGDGRVDR